MEAQDNLKDSILLFWNIGEKVLSENSLLFKDLEIIGDDAVFLMLEFGERFNVDLSAFDFDKYCVEEPYPFQYFYWKILNPKKLKRQTFSISHLIKVAKRRKWFDPPFGKT